MSSPEVAVNNPPTCANGDCRIAEGGKCIEGLTISTCPHYGKVAAIAVSAAEDLEEGEELESNVQLSDGRTLTSTFASALLREDDSRVIAVLGPSDAGKTSLIAGLYDLFQEGPVGNATYSRSNTLHGFELSCHDARAASQRNIPHINRTPLGEVRFYHLRLSIGESKSGICLLLGDRAGEEYRSTMNDPTTAASLPELSRADCLTVLVDGGRLLDSGLRHNLRSEIKLILQAIVDSNGIPPGKRLALVLTKIDAIKASPHQARAHSDFDALAEKIRSTFGEFFSIVECFQVAAAPKVSDIKRGTGIDQLLEFWLQVTSPITKPAAEIGAPISPRLFGRLQPLDT